MATEVKVKFHLRMRDKDIKSKGWLSGVPIIDDIAVPGDVVLAHVDAMFEDYATNTGLTCCSLQGGFIIWVNDIMWNSAYSIDEFWMTESWFHGLVSVLESNDPNATGKAYPWEQSQVVITRNGDTINIKDEATYDAGKPTDVNLWRFVKGIIEEGQVLESYLTQLAKMCDEHKDEDKFKTGAPKLKQELESGIYNFREDQSFSKLKALYDKYAPKE